ncbi:hypothetical protein MCOR01_011775 [Pyricularia oryzae]|nr:hypothetical protein MCOR01_011775 [Pyricularia oryzae]
MQPSKLLGVLTLAVSVAAISLDSGVSKALAANHDGSRVANAGGSHRLTARAKGKGKGKANAQAKPKPKPKAKAKAEAKKIISARTTTATVPPPTKMSRGSITGTARVAKRKTLANAERDTAPSGIKSIEKELWNFCEIKGAKGSLAFES